MLLCLVILLIYGEKSGVFSEKWKSWGKSLCSKYQILWDLQWKHEQSFLCILEPNSVILDNCYWICKVFFFKKSGLLAYFCVIYGDKPDDLTLCESVMWSVSVFSPLVLIIRCCTDCSLKIKENNLGVLKGALLFAVLCLFTCSAEGKKTQQLLRSFFWVSNINSLFTSSGRAEGFTIMIFHLM